MEGINAAVLTPPTGTGENRKAFAELGTEDFLALLISQLTNQDPLDPMGSDELLTQISSIRDIELSTTLTDSLRSLTGQERFGAASSLIGQYVTGQAGDDGVAPSGIVMAVRFGEGGTPILQLSGGGELPMDRVQTIESPARVAEQLIGQEIVGVDRRTPTDPQIVRGVVTAVRSDKPGELFLELDTGEELRLQDVVGLADSEAA